MAINFTNETGISYLHPVDNDSMSMDRHHYNGYFFAITLALICYSTPCFAQSIWNHNGSEMRLLSDGNSRKFIYETPREGLPVKKGQVLFEGERNQNSYRGVAFRFSTRCGQLKFNVSGPISADQTSITLRGQAPRWDSNCKISSYYNETLIFTFLRSVEKSKQSTNTNLISVLIVSFAVIIGLIILYRRIANTVRCPKCNTRNKISDAEDREVLDSKTRLGANWWAMLFWNSGRDRNHEQYIQNFYYDEKVKYNFRCKNCGHHWTKIIDEYMN